MIPKLMRISLIAGISVCAAGLVDAGGRIPPIREVKNVKPNAGVFKGSSWKKPIVIRSEKDAAKHFDKENLANLKKQANFKKQFVLLFAWQGSGGDRLSFVVAESFPEQVFFSRKAGLTDDLRQHVRIFALRSNVKWNVRGN